MFDNLKIAKTIKQARIQKNMTQLNLADAMGVSYQAVSNWERGNSMPDISKLEELCQALDLSVEALLGMESVKKAMDQSPLTMEELAEAAPMMPPQALKAQVEQERQGRKIDLSAIAAIAPFLDEQYLDQLVQDAELSDLAFLHEVAPYLSQETLEALVEKVEPGDLKVFDDVLCYLSSDTIDRLLRRCVEAGNFEILKWAAPFASTTGLDALVDRAAPGGLEQFADVLCFLSEDGVDRLILRCFQAGNTDSIKGLAVYASEQGLDALVDACIAANRTSCLEGIYCYLATKSVKKLARHLMEQKDIDALSEIGPYL